MVSDIKRIRKKTVFYSSIYQDNSEVKHRLKKCQYRVIKKLNDNKSRKARQSRLEKLLATLKTNDEWIKFTRRLQESKHPLLIYNKSNLGDNVYGVHCSQHYDYIPKGFKIFMEGWVMNVAAERDTLQERYNFRIHSGAYIYPITEFNAANNLLGSFCNTSISKRSRNNGDYYKLIGRATIQAMHKANAVARCDIKELTMHWLITSNIPRGGEVLVPYGNSWGLEKPGHVYKNCSAKSGLICLKYTPDNQLPVETCPYN